MKLQKTMPIPFWTVWARHFIVILTLPLYSVGQPTSIQACEQGSADTLCLVDHINQNSASEASMLKLIHNGITQLLQNEAQGRLTSTQTARDCWDLRKLGYANSGVYTIHPFSLDDPIRVYCDMETDRGGWTVFQRRQDGSVDFYRNWADYRDGFGILEGEHWLGNKNIHAMSEHSAQEMRIELGDWENNRVFAHYERFHVGSEDDKFRLMVSGYSGTAGGDSLSDPERYQNGQFFSTYDRNNGPAAETNCAEIYHSAFWFQTCYRANLNGVYRDSSAASLPFWGVSWDAWKPLTTYSLRFTEMKMRPVQ